MAIENINDYAGMWANGVNIGQMWDLIKAKFVSGAHDQTNATSYPNTWKVRARNNIGLPSLAAGQMWYAQGPDLLDVINTTAMGRGLLNKGITQNAIWYGRATNTIDEIITSQVGRDVLVTTGASAVANLWATKATTDSRDSVIINTYGTDLAFDGNTLKLKNNASAKAFIGTGIETNANSGLVRLTGGKIPLSVFPDAILGQLTFGGNISSYDSTDDGLVVSLTDSAKAILEERSGKSLTGKVIVLVATSTKPADAGQYVFFNYADCKGMYFIWKESALESHTGETVKYRIWPSGGPRYQAGDWMNSLESEWDKVDNTDAVTGVKGNAESVYRLGLVNITAQNVRALDTGLPNEIQNVQGKVEFEKDIWSLGGIAAYGVSDLSMGAGGGGGLSGSILRNWASYDPNDETQILGSNLGIESFRMTGAKFQFMRNKTWTDGFTLADSNIPDLPLTKITGTDDLRAIEALTGTGILKRTGNNTWALRDAAGLRSDAGITGDIYTHNYSEFVTAVSISGTNLSVTKNGQATTTAINAATLQGHAADYFATQEAFESAVSTLSGGIGQVLAMAQDNAENIDLHDDRITDLESYFDGASVKNALALDGHGASYFGTASAVSTLQGYFTNGVANNADMVDGHHASEFVGALGVSGNNLTWTRIGGTAQNITVPYATNAGQLGSHSSDWYQQKVTALGSATQPVYISAAGTFSAGSTYAGGTKVTLNGSDKGASTASFYAPAAAGTSGYWLKSSGSGAPVWESQANMLAGRATRMEQETMQETQEFIFRNSPKTIGADSLKLDRILGRTLAWNQLFDAKDSVVVNGMNVSHLSNGLLRLYCNNATFSGGGRLTPVTKSNVMLIQGHKYLFYAPFSEALQGWFLSKVGEESTYINFSSNRIFFTPSSTYEVIVGFNLKATGTYTVDVSATFSLFDLTLMFGAGNEPSTIEEFEALFPNTYYSYNPGQLINNSAEGLETVGFNIWDEEWDKGSLDSTTGQPIDSVYVFRSKNYIPVISGQKYCFHYGHFVDSNNILFVSYYGHAFNYLSVAALFSNDSEVTIPDGVGYIKIRTGGNSPLNYYTNDICINISNTNKNGQYEPYKRNVLDLHLNNIQVKSPNIWDEEWEYGAINTDGTEPAAIAPYTYWRAKNKTEVIPSVQYYIKANRQTQIWIAKYDALGVFIEREQLTTSTYTTYTAGSNVHFIKVFMGGSGNFQEPNNDVCINKSDPAFNGRYFPHGTLTFNGLKQAGDIRDEIVGNKLIRRVGEFDLATLTWGSGSYSQGSWWMKGALPFTYRHRGTNSTKQNITAEHYINSNVNKIYAEATNHLIGLTGSEGQSEFYVSRNDTTTPYGMCYYELENYETYDLVAPIPTAMPAGTTERRLPEDTSDSVLAPFACDITYGTNPGDILASGIAWEKIWGRPILEKGLYSDATLTPAISTDDQNNTAWFKLPIGDTALYIKFAVGDKAFRLQVADDDMNPTVSKEFEFATLSTADINAICV